jgi:ribosome-binding protein aMBF1 (putative translation factor)
MDLRNAKNITQKELGELIFHKQSTISKWEFGKLVPNIDSIKELALFFNILIEEMMSSTILDKTKKWKRNMRMK